MIHIAVDESGSFGAVVSGERYFIIGALRVKGIKPLRRLFRQAKRYALPKRLRRLAEVKASAAPDKFRERLYCGLSQLDVEIVSSQYLGECFVGGVSRRRFWSLSASGEPSYITSPSLLGQIRLRRPKLLRGYWKSIWLLWS